MSQPTSKNLPATAQEKQQAEQEKARQAEEPTQYDDLHTERGDTEIAEIVVQKIAGIAAREIPGVFAMGSVARRTLNNLTQRIQGGSGQPSVTGGVAVQKGERETAIDISVVVEYGAQVVQVSQAIRENVIRAVEEGTGLNVVSVDVSVSDVHLPGEDDDNDDSSGSADLR